MTEATATYTGNDTGNPASEAVERLLAPLARLCLANGIRYSAAEELLRKAFVAAAQSLQSDLPQHGMVSRIATATGIGRREVTRIVQERPSRRSVRIPLTAQIIARWTADPAYRSADDAPLALKRQGDCPSFESLARSVTQDIHPRSVLEELLRLGIVSHDETGDLVNLLHSEYVPGSDREELLAMLAGNVGDHFESAVANVVQDDIQHHDQAIFADELSEESAASLAPLIMSHWHSLRDDLVPAITACIEADRQAGRQQNQRVRIGLYSFSEAEAVKGDGV